MQILMKTSTILCILLGISLIYFDANCFQHSIIRSLFSIIPFLTCCTAHIVVVAQSLTYIYGTSVICHCLLCFIYFLYYHCWLFRSHLILLDNLFESILSLWHVWDDNGKVFGWSCDSFIFGSLRKCQKKKSH